MESEKKNKRTRNKSILIRMTEDEHKKYTEKLKKSKLIQQQYLLKCVLNKNITVIEGGYEVAQQLRAIGNNFNQLTRLANTGLIDDCNFELNKFNEELKEIWLLLRALKSKQA